MAVNSPLTDDDFESIKQQLTTLDELDEQLRLAQLAGVDVSEQKKQARESRTSLNQLKTTYFPGKA